MQYPKILITLLNDEASKDFYIGTGNPNAKIIIFGKEEALDENDIEGRSLSTANRQMWCDNVLNDTQPEQVENWNGSNFNPLHAYKGAKKGDNSSLEEVGTWAKYQKLHNFIFCNGKEFKKGDVFSFQDNFFISEINANPARTSNQAEKSNIAVRKRLIQAFEFYQSFEVVILACGDYINGRRQEDGKNEIERMFNVNFWREVKVRNDKYWVHFNANYTKCVIHTRQLSNSLSDEFLKTISEEVKAIMERFEYHRKYMKEGINTNVSFTITCKNCNSIYTVGILDNSDNNVGIMLAEAYEKGDKVELKEMEKAKTNACICKNE